MSDQDSPVFRVVTPRGITSSFGTKVYAFGREIPFVEKVETRTIADGPDEVVRTEIKLTLVSTQVVTECQDAPPPTEDFAGE